MLIQNEHLFADTKLNKQLLLLYLIYANREYFFYILFYFIQFP
jgi:hypothetical protein